MKLFKLLRSAFFAVFALFLLNTFTGCDPEKTVVTPDEPELTKVLASYEAIMDNFTYTINFNYNDEGVIESFFEVSAPNDLVLITYENGKLIKVAGNGSYDEYKYDANGNLIENLYYSDNDGDGIIGLYNKTLYSYNSNNQVIREDEIYYYEKDIPDSWVYFTLYQYENNESKSPISGKEYKEIDGDGGTLNSEKTYIYENKTNPFHTVGIGSHFVMNDFVPSFSPNIFSSVSTATVDGLDDSDFTVTNTYDEDGDLTKSTYTIARPGSEDYIYSVAFTYKPEFD